MLVITGTQRSGTSVVAKLIAESGVELHNAAPWDEGAMGGYEHEGICAFYRNYLGDPRFPFDDMELPDAPGGLFSNGWRGVFADMNPRVAKFSYLLMNPAFVTIWNKFRPDPRRDKFLVMLRSTQSVVQSKLRRHERFQHDSVLLKQGADVLEENRGISYNLLVRLYHSTWMLPFPACLNDREMLNGALRYLQAGIEVSEDVWDRVVDKSKVNF